jgi:hypothetical protein
MSSITALVLGVVVLLFSASSGRDRFAKYKAVEAYEVRKGVLLMPRYAPDGELCEIGLQRRAYSPESLHPSAAVSRDEINQIFDELVPADERGLRSAEPPLDTLITQSGHTMTFSTDYENVRLLIAYEVLPNSGKRNTHHVEIGDDVAVIQWKNRKCQ